MYVHMYVCMYVCIAEGFVDSLHLKRKLRLRLIYFNMWKKMVQECYFHVITVSKVSKILKSFPGPDDLRNELHTYAHVHIPKDICK
jgi:hypothetical protein